VASAFNFWERYHKEGDGFFNRIVRVTCDETSVSVVNVETKEQFKAMDAHSLTERAGVYTNVVCLPES
jgi:hypothetical protein